MIMLKNKTKKNPVDKGEDDTTKIGDNAAGRRKTKLKAIAIIPAFNEEKTIGSVLEILRDAPLVTDTVVVSDGSTDQTVEVARQYGAKVIELVQNRGKGGAMKAGLDCTAAEVILFLDADLIGLTSKHICDLLEPVLNDQVDMTIGIFEKGRIATDLAQKVAPYLSGQRAVKRSVLENLSGIDVARFGVEVALTRHIESAEIRVKEVVLQEMSHVIKEEKLGVIKGFAARVKMYWEIVKCMTNSK